MTNHDAIAHAISGGLADKDLLLTQILTGRAAMQAPRKSNEWKHVTGWVCTAFMLCFVLFGYFNGNITFDTPVRQSLDLAGAAADIKSEENEISASANNPKLTQSSAPPLIEKVLVTPTTPLPNTKQALSKLPLQDDGWVRINQEVKRSSEPYEPKFETDTSDSSSYSPPPKPPIQPSKPIPIPDGDGSNGPGGSNPDTGGGSDLFEIPYLRFTTDTAYNSYRGYIPRDLIGFSSFPFVSYAPPDKLDLGWVEISYGNPNGTVKQIFSISVKGNPKNEPKITNAAQITEALLKSLNKDNPQNTTQTLFISVSLNIQNCVVAFDCQNVTYQEAVQVLQSLPALNGGTAP